MGSHVRSSRLKLAQGMFTTSSNGKCKLEPTKESIPGGTPSRSTILKQSTHLQVVMFTTSPSRTKSCDQLHDYKDKGTNDESDVDEDSSDCNQLLGNVLGTKGRKEVCKKVEGHDASGSTGSQGQEIGGISMGGKGSKVLEKEGMTLCKGTGRFEKKLESSQKKGGGPSKCVSKIESFDKIEKSLEMDIDEKEFVEGK